MNDPHWLQIAAEGRHAEVHSYGDFAALDLGDATNTSRRTIRSRRFVNEWPFAYLPSLDLVVGCRGGEVLDAPPYANSPPRAVRSSHCDVAPGIEHPPPMSSIRGFFSMAFGSRVLLIRVADGALLEADVVITEDAGAVVVRRGDTIVGIHPADSRRTMVS